METTSPPMARTDAHPGHEVHGGPAGLSQELRDGVDSAVAGLQHLQSPSTGGEVAVSWPHYCAPVYLISDSLRHTKQTGWH